MNAVDGKVKKVNRMAGLEQSADERKERKANIVITAPNFQIAKFTIVGDTPFVSNKFSARAQAEMHAKMEQGKKAQSRNERKPKEFKLLYEESMHKSKEGWYGISAPSFRNAMIAACRVAGFVMTKAKLAVFVVEDGIDATDGTPLVRISKGRPKYAEHFVRNESGVVDLRPRGMWDAGWEAELVIRFDADMFGIEDIANLVARAGLQVGVGAGRPNSAKSNGMGWGLFSIKDKANG